MGKSLGGVNGSARMRGSEMMLFDFLACLFMNGGDRLVTTVEEHIFACWAKILKRYC